MLDGALENFAVQCSRSSEYRQTENPCADHRGFPTLAEMGVDYKQSAEWHKLTQLPRAAGRDLRRENLATHTCCRPPYFAERSAVQVMMKRKVAAQAPCVVAMEACAGAHYWAREIAKLGHHVRLIPPSYVKPFVKRQKNDAADAEAICEAAQRPTMRFVAVKSEAAQANAVVFRARDLLVRQRTQCVNALRGHLMEYGYVFP